MLCRDEATFDSVFELGAAKPTCVAYVDLDAGGVGGNGHRLCIFGSLTTATPYTTSSGIRLSMEHGSLYTLLQSNASLAIKYTTDPGRSIYSIMDRPLVTMAASVFKDWWGKLHLAVMEGREADVGGLLGMVSLPATAISITHAPCN